MFSIFLLNCTESCLREGFLLSCSLPCPPPSSWADAYVWNVPSRAEHYTLSKAQLKCHLPATVSLAAYLSLDYNRSWHPGQLSVFADGMAYWALACAYYRAPHQVKHQREPSRSSSSCILASLRAETILFILLNCCGFASAQWSQEKGQFAPDLLSQPQLDG